MYELAIIFISLCCPAFLNRLSTITVTKNDADKSGTCVNSKRKNRDSNNQFSFLFTNTIGTSPDPFESRHLSLICGTGGSTQLKFSIIRVYQCERESFIEVLNLFFKRKKLTRNNPL